MWSFSKREGKSGPASAAIWRKALDVNPEATRATIAEMQVSINLSEVGHGNTGENIAASEVEYSTAGLTPAELARIASFRQTQEASAIASNYCNPFYRPGDDITAVASAAVVGTSEPKPNGAGRSRRP